eukprot:365550-Chlamydomonas_euryale.AAC.6
MSQRILSPQLPSFASTLPCSSTPDLRVWCTSAPDSRLLCAALFAPPNLPARPTHASPSRLVHRLRTDIGLRWPDRVSNSTRT